AGGPGRSVGRIPGDLGGRNAARLYVCGRGRGPVRSLLDPARDPASRRAPTSYINKADHKMRLLTPEENRFLDVFLHEATTAPFTGPATQALHRIGVEYGDISYIAWAYEQEVPRTSFVVGHAADIAPALPWPNRQSALRRI